MRLANIANHVVATDHEVYWSGEEEALASRHAERASLTVVRHILEVESDIGRVSTQASKFSSCRGEPGNGGLEDQFRAASSHERSQSSGRRRRRPSLPCASSALGELQTGHLGPRP